MGERTSYAPGTPSWVDLGSPNPAESAAFYGALFGWETSFDPRPESGGYGMFSLDGKLVAGIGPQTNMDMPPYWTVYVSVADADATLASAEANGGTVVMPGMDVFDAGRMGIIRDPNGAVISVWQPGAHIGAQVVNDPGSFVWSELATTDVAATRAFYPAVFGWTLGDSPDNGAMFLVDGNVVCGAHAAEGGEPPMWSAWFAVTDCDAAIAKGVELGATVAMPAMDTPFGRLAALIDPHGAMVGLGSMNAAAG